MRVLWYCLLGFGVIILTQAGGIAYLFVKNYNLDRDNDALQRANTKMQNYICDHETTGWNTSVVTQMQEVEQMVTRVMTEREIAQLHGPELLGTRVRKPHPHPPHTT